MEKGEEQEQGKEEEEEEEGEEEEEWAAAQRIGSRRERERSISKALTSRTKEVMIAAPCVAVKAIRRIEFNHVRRGMPLKLRCIA